MLNTRPTYSRLPACYKSDGSVQILNSDFYETGNLLFEQFDDLGISVITSLTWSNSINRTKYLYLVNYENTPIIQAVEYGLQLPSLYLIIPDSQQFIKPKESVADWFTRYWDNLSIEKYYQVQQFVKNYLDWDYLGSNYWWLDYCTGGLFQGIFSDFDDVNLALRYFHSNELGNNEYWIYTQSHQNLSSVLVPYSRPLTHYNLTTGITQSISNEVFTTEQNTVDVTRLSPVINQIIFDWGSTLGTLPVLNSTQILEIRDGNTTLITPSNNTANNLWRARGIPTNSEWLGVLGSKGSSNTLAFILNCKGYYGHRHSDLVNGLFVVNTACVYRPLTLWHIPALTIESGTNIAIVNQSIVSDFDCFSSSFIRCPLSLPRTELTRIKTVVKKFAEEGSTQVSYAYFASDIGIVGEPIFDSNFIFDNYYVQY